MVTDKQLEILHDHYKETFARIREAEQSRDRLFLWVIVLFALLSLEIGYPAAVGGSLGSLNIAGAEFKLQALPLPALLDATWVFTLAIVMRYCQVALLVNRQYPYLHMLEENISPLIRRANTLQLGDVPNSPPLELNSNIYHREGRVYLNKYPLLLNVAWIAYVILFPAITIVATMALAIWEINKLPYSRFHLILDAIIAIALIVFLFLYWIVPQIASRVNNWWSRRHNNKNKHAGKRNKRGTAAAVDADAIHPTQLNTEPSTGIQEVTHK